MHFTTIKCNDSVGQYQAAMACNQPKSESMNAPASPRSMNALWMPFTSNRRYKSDPILIEEGHGMHYVLSDGRRILDSTAGLWCVNAGHGRDRITNAIADQ